MSIYSLSLYLYLTVSLSLAVMLKIENCGSMLQKIHAPGPAGCQAGRAVDPQACTGPRPKVEVAVAVAVWLCKKIKNVNAIIIIKASAVSLSYIIIIYHNHIISTHKRYRGKLVPATRRYQNYPAHPAGPQGSRPLRFPIPATAPTDRQRKAQVPSIAEIDIQALYWQIIGSQWLIPRTLNPTHVPSTSTSSSWVSFLKHPIHSKFKIHEIRKALLIPIYHISYIPTGSPGLYVTPCTIFNRMH